MNVINAMNATSVINAIGDKRDRGNKRNRGEGQAMEDIIVFGGNNSLDFAEVRFNVLRIPEVSLRIREAQDIWDESSGASFSFQHFLNADDNSFFNNINLKTLTLAVVQLGLYDRYIKNFRPPQMLIGNVENESAALVVAGKISLREMIERSQACCVMRPMAPLHVANDLILKGHSLPRFQAYREQQGEGAKQPPIYAALFEPLMSLAEVIERAVDCGHVSKIVHVGPGMLDKSVLQKVEMREIQILESIDLDPMLGWFWSASRRATASA